MSLVTCAECKKDISTTASACPNCGAKQKPIIAAIDHGLIILAGVVAVGVALIFVSRSISDGPATESPSVSKANCAADNFSVVGGTAKYVIDHDAVLSGSVKSSCSRGSEINVIWVVNNPDGTFSRFSALPSSIAIEPNQEVPFSIYATIPSGMPHYEIVITPLR